MAKVSVIIPVYKVEKYLERCVKSVINQTLKDIEIILVDDGSPDICPKMCDDFAEIDSRVKVIHKKNQGLGMARNSGLEIATAEYVMFVDSDDYIHHEMCETLYDKAILYCVDGVLCGYKLDINGNVVKCLMPGMPNQEAVIDYKMEYMPELIGCLPNEGVFQLYGFSVWNMLFKNEVIKNYCLKFESERSFVSEDALFQLDYASRANKLLLLPKDYYYYCQNEGSITKRFDVTRYDRQIELYKEICRRVKSYGLPIPQMNLRLKRVMLYECLFAVSEAIKYLSFAKSISRLKYIMNNEVLQRVLKTYPINEMTLQNKVFYTLLKRKSAYLVWFLFKFKKVFC